MSTSNFDPTHYSPSPKLLQDKVILVTGAGGGIGRAAAMSYARHGADVILLGRSQNKLEQVYDEIEATTQTKPSLMPLNLETATLNEFEDIADAIEKQFGGLDGLLHNASVLGQRTPLANYEPNVWHQVMQVNVNAAFVLTQVLIPMLEKAPSASVIFTSSGVGRVGRAYWGAYAVSKFATEGLMQTWADELADVSQIRCNCINPGATRTPMRAKAYPAEEPDSNPTPEQIMGLYLYLMGPDSKGVNGQSLDAQPKI